MLAVKNFCQWLQDDCARAHDFLKLRLRSCSVDIYLGVVFNGSNNGVYPNKLSQLALSGWQFAARQFPKYSLCAMFVAWRAYSVFIVYIETIEVDFSTKCLKKNIFRAVCTRFEESTISIMLPKWSL
jgi:hypothetical protein